MAPKSINQERGLTPSGASRPAGEPKALHLSFYNPQLLKSNSFSVSVLAPRPAQRLLTVSGPFLDIKAKVGVIVELRYIPRNLLVHCKPVH